MAHERQAILTAGIDFTRDVGLELGPLNRPVVPRSAGKVIYVDYTDTESLRQRYATDPNVRVSEIVDVDATWGGNTLQQAIGIATKVDYVVASHVIEHVPDLIAWLGELGEVLATNGRIRFAIPDRRYSFDYLRGETRLADVIWANMVHARVPQPHEVLDFALNKTQLDSRAAWNGNVDAAELGRDFTFEGCMHLAHDVVMNATYHDVHCWVFTPQSFARLMREMVTHGLTDLACDSFTDTSYGEFEFFVRVQRMSDQVACLASWANMERSAAPDSSVVRREEVAALGAALSVRDARLAEFDGQIAAADERIASMSDVIAQMSQTISELRAVIADYEHSRSWKLTAPFRAFSRMMSR